MGLALALGVAAAIGCGGKEDSPEAPANGGSTSTGGSAQGGGSNAAGGSNAVGGGNSVSMGGVMVVPPYGPPPIVD